MKQPNKTITRQRATGPDPATDGQTATGRNVSRGAALRAQKQAVQDANRVASQYLDAASKGNGQPEPAAGQRHR